MYTYPAFSLSYLLRVLAVFFENKAPKPVL